MLEMVLISEHIKPTNGDLKKIIMKKVLKKLVTDLSILHLLKSKKKVIILPLPIPM
jgi:type III secretory pathway component EscU